MSRPKREVQASLLVDLRSALEGWRDPLAFGLGLDGAVTVAARGSDEALMDQRAGAGFPKARVDTPSDWLVLRWQEGEVRSFVHRAESIAISYIQPLPSDGVVLAGARCWWTPQGPEKNAVLLDGAGRERGRITLGDGIQDLRVAPDGTLWVSYFDEGVFGNYGWSDPGPEPIGSSGLVQFAADGALRFEYDCRAAGTDSICDAYAMNLASGGDLWIYFYTEFPIVRLREGKYRAWSLGVAGANALAVRGDRAFLLGDYERPSLGRIVHLGDGAKAKVIEKVVVVDPSGKPIERVQGYGTGERIVFVKERQVFEIRDW